MHLVFSDQSSIEMSIIDNSLGNTYKKIYKHLSTLPIPYKLWDNPYYLSGVTHDEIINRLATYGRAVHVEVDIDICKSMDQSYFNLIHKIYEKKYNGNPAWLEFHEHIHICERYFSPKVKILKIDYREKSGLLERPMKEEWLQSSTTVVKAGDIFVSWAELGKTPYSYWKNKESENITRMCELSKPWLKLRPKINIALEDINLLENIQVAEFEDWWKNFEPQWAAHWGLESWSINNMYGVSVFGKTNQVSELTSKLIDNQIPIKVIL